jgi:hypothetical protein
MNSESEQATGLIRHTREKEGEEEEENKNKKTLLR